MKIRITALPWIAGQIIGCSLGLFSVDIAITSSFVVSLLAATENIDWF